MSVIQGGVIPGAGSGATGAERSLRCRTASAGNVVRSVWGTATNNKIGTWSLFVRRCAIGAPGCFIGGYDNVGAYDFEVGFDASDKLYIQNIGGSSGSQLLITTSQVFRDPSEWIHVVVAADTTQATAANRVKIWVNGNQVTSFSASNYPAQNNALQWAVNTASSRWGSYYSGAAFDGYITECYYIDGQQLDPTYFAQNDSNGIWVPKSYAGTYGNSGHYLNFRDASNLTNIALDSSGRGNNFTASAGISLTAGSTYDSMLDYPVNGASGTQPVGCYATLNPLCYPGSSYITDGNLRNTGTTTGNFAISTIGMSSGKFYCEMNVVAIGGEASVGIARSPSTGTGQYVGLTSDSWGFYTNGTSVGSIINNGSGLQSGLGAYTTNDVIGVAFDATNGTLAFYKNNVQKGTTVTGLAAGTYFFAVEGYANVQNNCPMNFGQRPFSYTPPTGYQALCTANLPQLAFKPSDHFDIATRLGTGAAASVTGKAFKPDMVWVKARDAATDHLLTDSVRGATKVLCSDATIAEFTDAQSLTAFNSDGYSIGTRADFNTLNKNYVDWFWKAGGAAVTNNAGSISSQVSANTAAGFSVVTYTGNGTTGATVGHGLGKTPALVIVKNRQNAGYSWGVWHSALAATEYLLLNSTAAKATGAMWNNTAPSSTLITLGASTWGVNEAQNIVAYCFAEIDGFSKFGSYTGNASADGPFVFCGFKPRWILIKRSDAAGTDWCIIDTARDTYNVGGTLLYADLANVEAATSSIDILSSGFKLRANSSQINPAGTLIFAAFAEFPFAANPRAR